MKKNQPATRKSTVAKTDKTAELLAAIQGKADLIIAEAKNAAEALVAQAEKRLQQILASAGAASKGFSFVLYHPNENDHASRPKNKPMPAMIVNELPHEYKVPVKNDAGDVVGEKTVTRTVYNLVVFQDSAERVVLRDNVAAKADMLPGERYIELTK